MAHTPVSRLARSASVMAPARHRADALIGRQNGDVAAAPTARKHGPTVDEYARGIEPHHRHHDAGQRLVAAGEAD